MNASLVTDTESVWRLQSIASSQVTYIVFIDQFVVTNKKGHVAVGICEKHRSSQVWVSVCWVTVTFRRDACVVILCSGNTISGWFCVISDHTVN